MDQELSRRRERLAALRQGQSLATIEVHNEVKISDRQEVEVSSLQASLLTGTTVEEMASWLMEEAQTLGRVEIKPGEELSLNQLAPLKPNADLRRELERRQQPLEKETKRAMATLVRQRLELEAKGKQNAVE